ncbi:hypothetical protein [Mycobacterium sp. pR1184]|uniref:hypothetical protein n=1 Tax=Mycobacterium sp. pR1184 TaxID=3238981 RepID=UPI00351B3C04
MTRLALLDQAAFLRLRATQQSSAVQCTWLYDRDVDIDELRSVQDRLGAGLLGRRIERSPLPFGRHRWVVNGESPDIVVEMQQPRSQVGAWIERRARVPVDPEYGPAFHLGVLPLDDGGTAVTMVSSHCVVEGLALTMSISEAVNGQRRNLGYPQPNSRTLWRAVAEDLADAFVALPAVVRAVIATLLILLKVSSGRPVAPEVRTPEPIADDRTTPPAVTLHTDAAAWEARARSINGSGNTLFVAFMARLAHRVGRVGPDGNSVTVVLPVSDRTTTSDDRANALTSITLSVDGRAVLGDLSGVRADIKNLLTALEHRPNEMLAGLPLIPFTPRWLVRRAEGIAMSTDQLPVGCSNMGSFDAAVGRIDGADASEVSVRLVEQGVTRRRIEQMRGQLFCATGTINGSRFLSVTAYQCGADNTAAAARELVCRALADIGLRAATVYDSGT